MVDVIVVEVQVAVVLSGFYLSFASVVATMVVADLDSAIAVVATIAVALSGFYLSFAAAVATMVVADAVIPAANNYCKSHRRRCLSTPFSYCKFGTLQLSETKSCGGMFSIFYSAHRRLISYFSLSLSSSYILHQFRRWCFLRLPDWCSWNP